MLVRDRFGKSFNNSCHFPLENNYAGVYIQHKDEHQYGFQFNKRSCSFRNVTSGVGSLSAEGNTAPVCVQSPLF